MRIEICGRCKNDVNLVLIYHLTIVCLNIHSFSLALVPDEPTNLTITNITSRSAEISWKDPVNTGNGTLTRFRIKLKKDGSVIRNITTNKVNKYILNNLTPYTTYEISVVSGNKHGFGKETNTLFLTSEEGRNGMSIFSSVIIIGRYFFN